MEIKYIENNNLDIIYFDLVFKKDKNINNIYLMNLWNNIIFTTSNKYPLEIEYNKYKNLYNIIKLNSRYLSYGNTSFLHISFTLPREGILKKYDLETSFKFCIDSIFHPNVINDSFDKEKFNYEKDYYLDRIKENNNSIYNSNYDKLLKIINNKELDLTIEEKYNLINNTNEKDLYEEYRNEVLDANFMLFVGGNFNRDKINDLINKYMNTTNIVSSFDSNIKMANIPLNKEIKDIQTNNNQTELDIAYSINNYNKDDQPYVDLMCYMMNGIHGLLFTNLRTNNSLVYQAILESFMYKDFFTISCYIDPSKYEIVLSEIRKCINELKDEEFFNKKKNEYIDYLNICILRNKDNEMYNFDKNLSKCININDNEELIKLLNKISYKDYLEFINKIEEKYIVLLRGTYNG